ncbi:MAG TPA: endonuclease III [Candidatus Polarisedimenticolaceae bacterium]
MIRRGGPSRVLSILSRRYEITRFREANGESPFRVLISCILSLRTKDETTYPATERLFARASDPAGMLKLREATIAKLIFPVGFYRRKAAQIRAISRILLERHRGEVPRTIDELLELPGVGRKTANLTVTLGYGLPGICVDVHVHRIANRLGWLRTRHPDETEARLREILPGRWWIPINETLVRHGQKVCAPVSPRCSICPVRGDCARVGVGKSR